MGPRKSVIWGSRWAGGGGVGAASQATGPKMKLCVECVVFFQVDVTAFEIVSIN